MGRVLINTDSAESPQMFGLPMAAVGLWARALCFVSAHRIGLSLPVVDAHEMAREDVDAIAVLLKRGLWLEMNGHYVIAEFTCRGEPAFKFEHETWSRAEYEAVYQRDLYACRYCGTAEKKLSIDHVKPRSQGGSDRRDNLVVACASCNSRKGGRTPEQAGMVLRPIPEAAR